MTDDSPAARRARGLEPIRPAKTLPATAKPGEVGVHDIAIEEELADLWTPGLTWLLGEGPLKDQSVEVFNQGESGPWVTVDKLERGQKVAPRFAIWRRTGAVHRVQEEGDPFPEAVEDDPIWTPQ